MSSLSLCRPASHLCWSWQSLLSSWHLIEIDSEKVRQVQQLEIRTAKGTQPGWNDDVAWLRISCWSGYWLWNGESWQVLRDISHRIDFVEIFGQIWLCFSKPVYIQKIWKWRKGIIFLIGFFFFFPPEYCWWTVIFISLEGETSNWFGQVYSFNAIFWCLPCVVLSCHLGFY